ncbi:hypothetical protein NECAME_17029 [Necator americanus]|uniref:Uncharacterized protein n=1 Tax=Necator americanus TaxID=51031 RepID=W2TSE4_NECAM|nr:hypothetical protein NECAME_17029 [Necator americanus]ETN84733.1 hypothetical protein NECAME_17029 [Necator americanus]
MYAVTYLKAVSIDDRKGLDDVLAFQLSDRLVWSSYFPNRNLRAFTIYPLAVFPQRYTHEEGYVSDTEDSAIVVEEVHEPKKPDKDEL